MTMLAVERVTTLPGTLSASTMYIVRDANDASLAEIVVTGTDVSEVRHVIKRDDLLATVAPLIANATAAVGTSLKLARQDHVHPVQTSVSGNAGTATALATARSIGMTGDATWSIASFDGSANVTSVVTLASVVTAGTGVKVTYNAKGLITGSTVLDATDIPNLDWAKITTGVPTFVKADGTVAMTGALTLPGDPTANSHAATKQYVDNFAAGLRDFKESVRAVSIANITLSGTQTIDGVVLAVGDRVLVTGQTTGSQNGIYVVAAAAWTRATDADSAAEVTAGMFVYVESGTTYQKTGWVLSTTGAITLGSTTLTFVQFNGLATVVGGTGISISGNTVSLANTTVTAGAYGATNKCLSATVDAQGRLTALTANNIAIAWSQITSGAPTSTVANIDLAVTNSHTHSNKTQLDKISEDGSSDFKYNSLFVKARGIELGTAGW